MATEDVTRSKGGGDLAEGVETGRRIHRRYRRTSLQQSFRQAEGHQQEPGPVVSYEGVDVIETLEITECIEERPLPPPSQASKSPKLAAVLVVIFFVLLFSRTELGAKLIDAAFDTLDILGFAKFL